VRRLLARLLAWLIADDPYPPERTAPSPWLDQDYRDELRHSA
jgi:hypothetical protein